MKYDILLVNAIRNWGVAGEFIKEYLGGRILASFLKSNGYEARVVSDEVARVAKFIERLLADSRVSIIGFYCAYDNCIAVRNLIRELKGRHPEVKMIAGGPQAVALGVDFLRFTGCAAVVTGEGEMPALELMNYYIDGTGSLESIKNIKFIDASGRYIETEARPPISDLDALPPSDPSCELTSVKDRKKRDLGILTGRGCPYRCSYCYEGAVSKNIRYRSVEKVFEEIDIYRNRYPDINYVQLYDDTFTLDRARIKKFCAEFKKRGIGWFCEAHILNLYSHPEIISEMVDSGLFCMQIGIESGSRKVLEAYNKKIDPEMILKVVEHSKSAGLKMVTGNFIIGGAFESPATIEESRSLARSILKEGKGMAELRTVFLAPYPETPISRAPEKYGLTPVKNYEEEKLFSMFDCAFETAEMKRSEIIRAKVDFDKMIEAECRSLVPVLDKTALENIWKSYDTGINLFAIWLEAVFKVEYVRSYMFNAFKSGLPRIESMSGEEILSLRPIRTLWPLDRDAGHNARLPEQALDGESFDFLAATSGIYTAGELADKKGISRIRAVEMVKDLEKRYLLYLSRY